MNALEALENISNIPESQRSIKIIEILTSLANTPHINSAVKKALQQTRHLPKGERTAIMKRLLSYSSVVADEPAVEEALDRIQGLPERGRAGMKRSLLSNSAKIDINQITVVALNEIRHLPQEQRAEMIEYLLSHSLVDIDNMTIEKALEQIEYLPEGERSGMIRRLISNPAIANIGQIGDKALQQIEYLPEGERAEMMKLLLLIPHINLSITTGLQQIQYLPGDKRAEMIGLLILLSSIDNAEYAISAALDQMEHLTELERIKIMNWLPFRGSRSFDWITIEKILHQIKHFPVEEKIKIMGRMLSDSLVADTLHFLSIALNQMRYTSERDKFTYLKFIHDKYLEVQCNCNSLKIKLESYILSYMGDKMVAFLMYCLQLDNSTPETAVEKNETPRLSQEAQCIVKLLEISPVRSLILKETLGGSLHLLVNLNRVDPADSDLEILERLGEPIVKLFEHFRSYLPEERIEVIYRIVESSMNGNTSRPDEENAFMLKICDFWNQVFPTEAAALRRERETTGELGYWTTKAISRQTQTATSTMQWAGNGGR